MNLLVFITHDTGRHLGCYGRGPATPHLDRLAAEGVRFTQAYCTAPQCSPSRASLMTGLHPHEHGLIGLLNRGFERTPGVPTLPGVLSAAGYATYLFGFQHEARDPATLGYRFPHALKPSKCAHVLPDVLAFLDSPAAKQGPFFANIGVTETHRPFPRAGGCRGTVRVPPYLPDVEPVRADVADLNALVETVDDAVGQILAALDRNGLSGNTLVLFTTDHGIAFPGAKATLFEPGIEIALIVRGPAAFQDGLFAGGRVIEAPVSNLDLMPTLLETAGLADRLPAGVHGVSLAPLLRGATDRLHDTLFFEQTYHSGYDPLRAVRQGRHKLIRSFEAERRSWYFARNVDDSPSKRYLLEHGDFFRRPRPGLFLFDLEADPDERTNLAEAPAHAAARAALAAELERWMRETRDPLCAGHIPPPAGAVIAADDPLEPDAAHLPADEYCRRRGWAAPEEPA